MLAQQAGMREPKHVGAIVGILFLTFL
jgi:hypothetical protein